MIEFVGKDHRDESVGLVIALAELAKQMEFTSLGPEGPVGETIRVSLPTDHFKTLMLIIDTAKTLAQEMGDSSSP